MAEPVLTYRGAIYPWHCDHMGHMNVMWYVGKFDEATWHLLASAGLTGKRLREEGIGMAAVEQRIEYKREVLAGDLITIHSWFQEVREKALLFTHEMVNEQTREVAARTFLTAVCLDTKTRKARPLPADVRQRIMKPVLIYFDTDAFHHFARTYQERSLPEELRGRIVLSTITMLEVLTHLVPESTAYKELQGLPNWMNKGDVALLPWPEESIAEMVLGTPPIDDSFLQAVGGVLNHCLNGGAEDLFESACELEDEVKRFKEERAQKFLPLVELCREHPELVGTFDEEWLKCVIPGLRNGRLRLDDAQKARVLGAIDAYREFELSKVRVAVVNAAYKPQKHQNDALDSQQLAYLCDPALHFLTCDKGYLKKVQLSAQRNRIHETSADVLSDPGQAEALLRGIVGLA